MLGVYAASLLLAALLIGALESPRGGRAPSVPAQAQNWHPPTRHALSSESWAPRLANQRFAIRYARSLVQTVAASGAGIPTESLAERNVSPGSKITLAALLLIGGLGGSATGGLQWPLLLGALAGGAAALGWSKRAKPAQDDATHDPLHPARCMRAGLACLFLLTLLALLVALGLLLIENWTASPFQLPPSFADALLDAGSVVGGGNLSSGLTESVTSRHLHAGIRQSANLYQYGMAWLMLAMLAGRMLPLVVLQRLASSPAPTRTDNR
jgi:Trk-type K+ transport system membrane component